ncbi:hypothetical protein D3C85_1873500 [compost metagenome]
MVDTGRTTDGMSDDDARVVFFDRFVDELSITRYIEFLATALSVGGRIYGDDSAS